MKDLRKRVAYIQGLLAGLELEDTKEGRVLKEIVALLEDVAEAIHDLHEDYEELEEYLEDIDEDLYDLEGEEGEEAEEDEEEEEEEGDYVEVECPKCHEIVCFDADVLDDEDVVEVTCPNCNAVVFVNEGGGEAPADRETDKQGDTEDI
ncbi:CD1247 N-terminal domain-containing protein [Moorellaceae bacterium AZ2]